MPAAFKKGLAELAGGYGDKYGKAGERRKSRHEPDRSFYFLDLPDGPYTLRATIPVWDDDMCKN